MLSIITAIYNGLNMNRLFYEHLKASTEGAFELIIIDNGSTDGSAEFFEGVGAKVIRNKANYSYPYCQNQGIDIASGDLYAFLNNDIIVAPGWDKRLRKIMREKGIDVICPSGIERIETVDATRKLKRRWMKIKYFLIQFGTSKGNLARMHRWMYGNWKSFCASRYNHFGTQTVEGFIGNTVIMTKNALEIIGKWDERIQAADFDLYLRSKKRNNSHCDILPVQIALGVFHHHFIRLTVKSQPPVFADADKLITLEEKWQGELDSLLADNVAI